MKLKLEYGKLEPNPPSLVMRTEYLGSDLLPRAL